MTPRLWSPEAFEGSPRVPLVSCLCLSLSLQPFNHPGALAHALDQTMKTIKLFAAEERESYSYINIRNKTELKTKEY